MSNIKLENKIKMTYYTDEEQKQVKQYISQQYTKTAKRILRKRGFVSFLKYVCFSPLSISTRVLAIVCKIIGSISAIGLPFGIYNIYKMIVQVNEGILLADIECTKWIAAFFILPFAAFALYYIFDKSSNYFVYNR